MQVDGRSDKILKQRMRGSRGGGVVLLKKSQSYQVSFQWWTIIGTLAKRWRANDALILVTIGSSLPSTEFIKDGHPLTTGSSKFDNALISILLCVLNNPVTATIFFIPRRWLGHRGYLDVHPLCAYI